MPPLPNFSHFHPKFRMSTITEEGVLRMPFFMAYEEVRTLCVSFCACAVVRVSFLTTRRGAG
jgi:hypothetical protein